MRQPLLLPIALFTVLFLIVAASSFQADSTFHRHAAHGFVVMMLPALPLSVILPLAFRWRTIRRKVLAVAAFLAPAILVGLMVYADSFTGYFIPRMSTSEHPPETLLRFKVLHRLGFPILMTLGLAALWTFSVRLARRRPTPER
ncbi:MAG TPA: hypothetical protein VNM14_13525 [Planctomycetota bacterium]|jgi:hypothetical protein|nr:hypothetical protein [Planctomycetota bacterium]